MTITPTDYITYLSLGISLASLVFVIFVFKRFQELLSKENHKVTVLPTEKVDDDDDVEENDDDRFEVSAIVSEFSSRLKRLEEALVDQKVKLEITNLRLSREIPKSVLSPASSSYGSQMEYMSQPSITEGQSRKIELPKAKAPPPPPLVRFPDTSTGRTPAPASSSSNSVAEKRENLSATEVGVLRMVFEGRGKITAKEIQQRIGKTREHTARMMNALYHEGLVERDVTTRPFAYSITQKGRETLNA